MSTKPDADQTLPSVITALPGSNQGKRLVLTIIFHPDTARIGESAVVPILDGAAPWVLGRRGPAFARGPGSPANALQDEHVSRQALALASEAEHLIIRRLPSSSRARVGGRELHDAVEFDREQLQKGVPIMLGHSVILLLRLAPRAGSEVSPADIGDLRGSSAYMNRLREQLAQLAGTSLDVLVRGETGTGKELVAAAIHRSSERRGRPMVSVNMAAVPPGLAAATLFGNARGAYTGATGASAGFFGQADGGTLFLDEIGDTPTEVQPQLLRALQEREIQGVGDAVRKVDVRVISATDAALEGEGCDFKAALRYRLAAAEIHLQPLREHPEDIGELLLYFLVINCRQLGRTGLLPSVNSPARDIAVWADLFHRFLGYAWPGNVRELANFASQVVAASAAEPALPDHIRSALNERDAGTTTEIAAKRPGPRRSMRTVTESEFHGAMEAADYEVTNVARQLGVSRQAIYRRMEESRQYRLAGQIPLAELEQALALRAGDALAVARDLKVSPSSLRARLRDSALDWCWS